MKIIHCDHSWTEIWNQFVTANSSDAGFLQSWQWGKFQEKLGRSIYRLVLQDDDGEILAVTQLIRMPLPLGKCYFYIPRGPIESSKSKVKSSKLTEYLFSEIKSLAKKEGAIFVRLDPAWQNESVGAKALKDAIPVGLVQPKQTLILDIAKSEEDLLSQMKSKCRYNIKVAQKHCVEIDEGEKYLDDFINLTKKTAQRDEFISHGENYYRQMLAALAPDGTMKLIVAKDGDKVIVANLVIFFGDWCVYLHGASDYDYRDQMAPYLLQWETIQLAKGYGKKYYDFWGVDEKKWPGVTRFKTGFAPERAFTQYVGAYDLPVSKWWYKIYKVLKRQ